MIEKLVNELPEIYQPVFGYSKLSFTSSRLCEDRLKKIEEICESLERLIRRPLRILDLGCAQGFFSLKLAERGAVVHGVDYLEKNINLCKALAKENPSLKVSFEEEEIEKIVFQIQPGQYDLVLGLSIFHHLIYLHGIISIQTMLKYLAEVSGALLLEFAVREEPLYWGPSQPVEPRDMINEIAFIRLIDKYETHLSDIKRPLFVASNRYWIFDEEAGYFNYWSFESHELSKGTHQFTRRYFFNDNQIIKIYRLDNPRGNINFKEISREISFLQNRPVGFPLPKLYHVFQNNIEIGLVREKIQGKLLLEVINNNKKIDTYKIILAVLKQLIELEEVGLTHNDIRAWNLIYDEINEIIHLIDYGSISEIKQDCVWPHNIYFSFFILIKEITSGVIDVTEPMRFVSTTPYGLSDPYKSWAIEVWKIPIEEWSFKLFYQLLKKYSEISVKKIIKIKAEDAWMNIIEEAIQILNIKNSNLNSFIELNFDKIKKDIYEILKKNQRHQLLIEEIILNNSKIQNVNENNFISNKNLKRDYEYELKKENILARESYYSSINYGIKKFINKSNYTQNDSENFSKLNRLNQLEQSEQLEQLKQEIFKIKNSRSWKITLPLRFIAFKIRNFFNI